MPPKRTTPKTPAVRLHKGTGQAYIRVHGRMVYCGRHDTPEAHAKAHRLLAEIAAHGGHLPQPADDLSVAELAARYLRHCAGYYTRPESDEPTGTQSGIRIALRPLLALYADVPARNFGPLALKTIRNGWIEAGLARTYINKQVRIVQRMFRWGVSEELIPADTAHALNCVEGLRRYRSKAKEPRRVEAVLDAHVEAALPHMPRPVAGLVRLQRATGARSGEIVGLRLADIDRAGEVWLVRLERHKTAHHGRARTLAIGPAGQAVIREYAEGRTPWDYLFQPAEADAERRAKAAAARKTPLHHGNRPGTNRKANPRTKPGEVYDVATYGRAVRRAVERCNADRRAHGLPEIPVWHPHQLRHRYAVEARRQFGLELAQAALGHATADMAEHYAQVDTARAIEVARAIG